MSDRKKPKAVPNEVLREANKNLKMQGYRQAAVWVDELADWDAKPVEVESTPQQPSYNYKPKRPIPFDAYGKYTGSQYTDPTGNKFIAREPAVKTLSKDWSGITVRTATAVIDDERGQSVRLLPGVQLIDEHAELWVVTGTKYNAVDLTTELTLQDPFSLQAKYRAEPLPGAPDQEPLPLHEVGVPLREGDKVVITDGEQRGLHGVVRHADRDVVWVTLTRKDGSTMQRNAHRPEYVGKLLDRSSIPKFGRIEDAEAWLAVHDRTPRQHHVTGSTVTVDDGTEGRVVAFNPRHESLGNLPAYRLLIADGGEPRMVWVPAHCLLA